MPEADRGPDDKARRGDLQLLLELGREASRIAMRYFRADPEVWMKAGSSPVSEADYAVDRFLRENLLAARPDYGWLSEETTDSAARLQSPRTFVVDPIDGTRGFLEGSDLWCVSIAVVENGEPTVGVLECPARQESFWALPGHGAFKNGDRLAVSTVHERPGIGGPKTMVDAMPRPWQDRIERRPYVPSLAYRLAMIAEGSLDATFVKANAHDWDLAAVDLIVAEAGGTILTAHGSRPAYAGEVVRHGPLIAGSGALLEPMLKVIAPQGSDAR